MDMNLLRYRYEIAVFLASFSIMVFEIVGSRVMGPYFGTSLQIWTLLIGIVLGSISLGYIWGGRKANDGATVSFFSRLYLFAGMTLAVTLLLRDIIISVILIGKLPFLVAAFVTTILLFGPTSFFLGAITPYAMTLKGQEEKRLGILVGNLSAISTIGSIVGTFAAGLILIPLFGTTSILIGLIVLLLLVGVGLFLPKTGGQIGSLGVTFLLVLSYSVYYYSFRDAANPLDVDTQYNRVLLYTVTNTEGNKVRILGINNENHSAMYLESNELVNEYTKYYDLFSLAVPNAQRVLMLGGAGYSYPKHALEKYPHLSLDVVEIDPGVTALARKYFRLVDDPRLTIYHQDARIFLNNPPRKYDAILGDAFGSRYAVPFHLTTKEAMEKIYAALSEEGIFIMNVISAQEGSGSRYLHAQVKTLQEVFPYVTTFKVLPEAKEIYQNIMIIASKSPFPTVSTDEYFNSFLQNRFDSNSSSQQGIVLTDEYAPVEKMLYEANF